MVIALCSCFASLLAVGVAAAVYLTDRRKRAADAEETRTRQARSVFGSIGPIALLDDVQNLAHAVGWEIDNSSAEPVLWHRARMWCTALPDVRPYVSSVYGRVPAGQRSQETWHFFPLLDFHGLENVWSSYGQLKPDLCFVLEIEFADHNGAVWIRRGVEPPELSPY